MNDLQSKEKERGNRSSATGGSSSDKDERIKKDKNRHSFLSGMMGRKPQSSSGSGKKEKGKPSNKHRGIGSIGGEIRPATSDGSSSPFKSSSLKNVSRDHDGEIRSIGKNDGKGKRKEIDFSNHEEDNASVGLPNGIHEKVGDYLGLIDHPAFSNTPSNSKDEIKIDEKINPRMDEIRKVQTQEEEGNELSIKKDQVLAIDNHLRINASSSSSNDEPSNEFGKIDFSSSNDSSNPIRAPPIPISSLRNRITKTSSNSTSTSGSIVTDPSKPTQDDSPSPSTPTSPNMNAFERNKRNLSRNAGFASLGKAGGKNLNLGQAMADEDDEEEVGGVDSDEETRRKKRNNRMS